MPSKISARSTLHVGRIALVFSTGMLFGCVGFAETPVDPASKIFPTVAANCACQTPPEPKNLFDHVVIVVLENANYEQAHKNAVLERLAGEGASFLDFHGLFHPSYSNYLAMVSGRAIATLYDVQINIDECTIADTVQSSPILHGKKLDWRSYAEGYPTGGQCYLGSSQGRYARKHVPLLSFEPVQQKQCSSIVPGEEFGRALATGALPSYAFYTPDLDNGGHDPGVETAAKWLDDFVKRLRASPAWTNRTLLVVTFDESGDQWAEYGNHIYTVLLGDMIKPGLVSGNYNHYNILRTIEDNFGLCPLGPGDAAAKAIDGIWKDEWRLQRRGGRRDRARPDGAGRLRLTDPDPPL